MALSFNSPTPRRLRRPNHPNLFLLGFSTQPKLLLVSSTVLMQQAGQGRPAGQACLPAGQGRAGQGRAGQGRAGQGGGRGQGQGAGGTGGAGGRGGGGGQGAGGQGGQDQAADRRGQGGEGQGRGRGQGPAGQGRAEGLDSLLCFGRGEGCF